MEELLRYGIPRSCPSDRLAVSVVGCYALSNRMRVICPDIPIIEGEADDFEVAQLPNQYAVHLVWERFVDDATYHFCHSCLSRSENHRGAREYLRGHPRLVHVYLVGVCSKI
jgi:hypothetical protein